MRIVVVTGMSGSGKSNALRALEDLGYYAIDNLPISLLGHLVELFSSSTGEVERLALVVDVRMLQGPSAQPDAFSRVPDVLEITRRAGHEVDLVFLDAEDDVLERRFSETRRRHPLSADGSVVGGILEERKLLEPLKQVATMTVDTSQMSVHDLRREIQHAFSGAVTGSGLSVSVVSFGFKHGVPSHADLLFDVRFLPNPHFVERLRPLTGNEPGVASYVLDRPDTEVFLQKVCDLLDFLLPRYEEEGKVYLTIAVGCTGGRHRSVAIANRLVAWLADRGSRTQVRHRDAER